MLSNEVTTPKMTQITISKLHPILLEFARTPKKSKKFLVIGALALYTRHNTTQERAPGLALITSQ